MCEPSEDYCADSPRPSRPPAPRPPQPADTPHRARPDAFTLIELLVVIAIIAVLMAILVPVMRRVREQGKTLVCQSRLRQIGMCLAMHTNENNGRIDTSQFDEYGWLGFLSEPGGLGNEDLLLCPKASAKSQRASYYVYFHIVAGSTFTAWEEGLGRLPDCRIVRGSYGWNPFVFWGFREDVDPQDRRLVWPGTTLVKSAHNVPVYLDAKTRLVTWVEPLEEPPPSDDEMAVGGTSKVCMNRHNGHVNALFLDWSVRKVGLKELWTLKWYGQYDTNGPWTTAGGVKPEDWPQWMRGFKDY